MHDGVFNNIPGFTMTCDNQKSHLQTLPNIPGRREKRAKSPSAENHWNKGRKEGKKGGVGRKGEEWDTHSCYTEELDFWSTLCCWLTGELSSQYDRISPLKKWPSPCTW
jgi:hypothetical protein